jgi:hypothetical protein
VVNFPRILFLTNEPPHTAAAGAVVFFRLFRDYPPENLLIVSNTQLPSAAGRLACRYSFLPLIADRLNRTRLWPWKAILRSVGASKIVRLRRVDALLAGFKPDIVLTLMQDSWFYDLAARYAAARRLPLVLFVHDLSHGFEPVPGWLQRTQLARDRAVYGQACVRLCISQPMVDYFAQEFRLSGEVLPPPRSENLPSQTPENCLQLKTPGRLTLGYAGGLHYGYGEQLLAMLPVLRETGTAVEVYGPDPSGGLAALRQANDVFHFNGYAPTPEDAARGVLGKCDAILQPYLNPPGVHARQYRTHFPSKLGDCLALGLPLLVTGPADAAGTAWCMARPGCALTVTEPEPAALATALTQLREDATFRVTLARTAQEAANEFAMPKLRAQLLAQLLLAAQTAQPCW